MSGSIQAAPTASMTVASGAATILPVTTGYYPQEGSRCVAAQYNWSQATGFNEDLSALAARGVETTIQAAWIDNSANPQAVTLLIGGSGQVVVVQGNTQSGVPLLFSGTPNLQISVAALGAATAVTRIIYLNYPLQAVTLGGTATYLPNPPELAAGSAGTPLVDAYGSLLVNGEGNAPTFSASYSSSPAAAATDYATLYGSAGKIIRLRQILLSFTAAAEIVSLQVNLIRRSSVNVGGTAVNPLGTPHDSLNAAAVASMTVYSVNPAGLGTTVGYLDSFYIGGQSGAAAISPLIQRDYGVTDQAIVLRGTAQGIALNFGGQALPAGFTVAVKLKWTEL